MSELQLLNTDGLRDKFERWLDVVANLHHGFIFSPNGKIHWTPLRKPLRDCRVALVTTAGVHRRDQPRFDMENPQGDPSFRELAGDVRADELMVTHDHYNHADADRDINCVFPIDRLRELAAAGEIGEVSPLHFGLMGFVTDPAPLLERTAPYVARALVAAGVDLAIFTPG